MSGGGPPTLRYPEQQTAELKARRLLTASPGSESELADPSALTAVYAGSDPGAISCLLAASLLFPGMGVAGLTANCTSAWGGASRITSGTHSAVAMSRFAM